MSSAQHDTFSPKNLTILGSLFLVALILGEVVFPRQRDNAVPVEVVHSVGSIEDIAMRLKPVVTLDDILANAGGMSAGAVGEKTPKDLYAGACLACHASGVAGAPKLGDTAAWQLRNTNGIDALLGSAISGKGAMPPKGGSTYSDDQLRAVIEFMLAESGQ